MKIQNKAFCGLDGKKLREQTHPSVPPADDAPVMTVATVLVNACLSAPGQGQTHQPDKAAKRYTLAIELYKAKEDDELEVPTEIINDLKADVTRLYAPIISGQFVSMIDAVK